MNKLQAGFGRVNVTPMLGIGIGGYFIPRFVEGVLDELEINALALACGDEKVLLMTIDNEHLSVEAAADFRKHITEVTGVADEAIYLHATHSHTTPIIEKDSEDVLEQEYYKTVYHKMALAAKMGWGIGQAPNIAFVRRFRMKDGSVKTNPGVNNPDILEPDRKSVV